MRLAVVDIGSNTVKMKIFEYANGKNAEVYSAVNNAKLISYITNGVMSFEGITLLCSVLSEFKEISLKNNCDVFRCFATASLRRTDNVRDILQTVYDFCGERIDLVSGEDEAFYSFSGVKHSMAVFPDKTILLDMGGGSTEIMYCEKGERVSTDSMGFGSLSLYLDVPNNSFDDMSAYAVSLLEKSKVYPVKAKNAVLVGGTALAISKLYSHFFPDEPEFSMTCSKLKNIYERLKPFDSEVLSLLERLTPHRVTTVIPGLAAYIGIFDACNVENITVSTCGIREGYVYEKLIKEQEKAK